MSRALVFFQIFLSTAFAQPYVISTIAGGVPPVTPAAAIESSIGDPPRVAVDTAGNTYFAGLHCVFKVDRSGTLSRIAGNGRTGNTGDGGSALNAQLSYPDGIAIDAAGNLYVSDMDAGVVRKITATGLISTVATQLNQPSGLALDLSGNLYIADTGNQVVRRLSATGAVTVFAGTGDKGYGGDGGLALSATFNGPQGIAVDSSFGVYIADTFNNRVRRVSSDGTITTVAGNGRPTFAGDEGPAPSNASLFFPTDVALDRNGAIYIADLGNSRIRVVRDGIVATIAGSQTGRFLSDGSHATQVRLSGPTGVAVDAAGTVYFAEGSVGSGSGLDRGDYRVWKITPAGIINAVAGNGVASFAGDGGSARTAQFNMPTGIALDPDGNLFLSDTLNQRVRRITPAGRIGTLIGNGVAGWGGDFDAAVNATVNRPGGLGADLGGNMYLADTGNSRVRGFRNTGNIDPIAGNGNSSYFGDGLRARAASINHPQGVASDSRGSVYIADTLDNAVRKVTPDGIIRTIAGTGTPGFAGDGRAATSALLNGPKSVVLDAAGNLYIADSGNNAIRKVDTSGIITTIATGLSDPRAIAVDTAGAIFIADTGHNQIAKIAPGGTLATIAGAGTCCYAGDDGPAASALLNAPAGIAVDPFGNVYFTDSGNNAIRVLQPLASSPVLAAITNAGSNLIGPIAPGEMVVLYGSGIGPLPLASGDGGVTVLFNGTPAAVLYASATQVAAVVPATLLPGASAAVVVQYQNRSSAPLSVPVVAAAPALFTLDSVGTGQAVAVNQDGSLNGSTHPARPGGTIVMTATGIPGGAGITANIGGQTANVVLNLNAPAQPGVVQFGLQIPPGVAAGGAVPVVVRVGNAATQSGVTISVSAI
jgi:uncharacterized protein (TIGR03437 family)